MVRASVNMDCQDIFPFETISGQGFVQLVQQALEIQHSQQHLLDAKDLLSHPTTISRKIKDRAASVREKLSSDLHDAFSQGHVSFTTDICGLTPIVRYLNITITAHWIINWELHSQVVCTEEFDATIKKTGINIRAAISSVFSSLGIRVEELKKAVHTQQIEELISSVPYNQNSASTVLLM